MIFDALDFGQARAYLRDMVGNPKWDTSSGLCSIENIIGRGAAYLVADEGGPLVVIVLQQLQHDYGRELVIRVAMQLAACGDLTERVLPEIERRFGAGCQAVTVYTRRAGLVAKLQTAGYHEAAKIMRKKL